MTRTITLLVAILVFIQTVQSEMSSDLKKKLQSMEKPKYFDECVAEFKPNFEAPGPTKDHMCFAKCMAEGEGIIEKGTGIVHPEKVKNLPLISEIGDVGEMEACLKGVKAVKTCEEIGEVYKCLPKMD